MGGNGNLGPYEILGELGRGAMARVWRAWDPNLQREVAIKEPLLDPRLSPAVLEEMGRRFVEEARAAARLAHAGIVTIYAADVYDGRPAIVMELIKGETLTSWMRHGPVTPTDALAMLDQLLDAVGYAHECGVVHRDIKPENIFVTSSGVVKLADFGVAHVEGSAATVAGQVLGTPGYMSPEQATGAPVDARSDLFSVGVVAYEMLAGRNPFGAGEGVDATTLLYRIVHEPVPELPAFVSEGLPNDLRPAVMAALEKDPAARPQSAAAFKDMLHNARSSRYRRSVAPSATGSSTPSRAGAPSWLPYVLVAGVAIVALGIVLANALGGPSGSGSGSSQQGSAATNVIPSDDSTDDDTGALYYVGLSDGKVAIYVSGSDEPAEVSDVEVGDLGSESAAELGARISCSSLDEAESLIEEYRAEAEEAQQADEEQKAADDASTDTSTAESSEYILPESNTRYYTREELEELSDWELWMARNEIYARNGRMFDNQEAQEYFNGKSWYVPRYTPDEFDQKGVPRVYNDYERQNRSLIQTIEAERGSSYA